MNIGIGMLLIHLLIDGIYLNFQSLMSRMSSLNKDFASFLALVVYRLHTWTPCWLIFPSLALGCESWGSLHKNQWTRNVFLVPSPSFLVRLTSPRVAWLSSGLKSFWKYSGSWTPISDHWLISIKWSFFYFLFICTYQVPFLSLKMIYCMSWKQYIMGSRSLPIYGHLLNTHFTQYSNIGNNKLALHASK